MAVWTIKRQLELGKGFILSPERYDPRRSLSEGMALDGDSSPLSQYVHVVRTVVNASTRDLGNCLVLDTSHAREGVITIPKGLLPGKELGSAKKTFGINDVIISRLRPYLRQVAIADEGISLHGPSVNLLCSTEFFVLRSINNDSIAFLVPFLLSSCVQSVLCAAQEGGHHPRFDETTLLSIPVPKPIVKNRSHISERVERSISLYRQSETIISGLLREMEGMFEPTNSCGRS